MDSLDPDLAGLSREQAIDKLAKLRSLVRQQRDSKGHNQCWWWPELWAELPEQTTPSPEVPPFPEFIQQCAAFRGSLEGQAQMMQVNTEWDILCSFGMGESSTIVFGRKQGGVWEYRLGVNGGKLMVELSSGKARMEGGL